MTDLIEYLVQGILLGSVYGLVALPISVVYTTTHSIDAAVGGHALIAATTAAAVGGLSGAVLGVAAGIVSAAVVGIVYLLLRSRGSVDPITIVLATFGIAFALQALVLLFHGRSPIVGHAVENYWNIAGISINPLSALNLAFGLIAMIALSLVLRRSSLGRSLRACADSPLGAQLAGIPVGLLQLTAILIGGALASVAGVLLLYTSGIDYSSGMHITLTALGAAVLFGFRGPAYGFMGGLLFGIVQALVTGYTSSGLAAAIPYLFIFVILASGRSAMVVSRA